MTNRSTDAEGPNRRSFLKTSIVGGVSAALLPALGGAGGLNPNFFFAGAAAHDANDHIIYNKTAGTLVYDVNGNAAGGATLLAGLIMRPTLFASDFVVI